LAEKRLPQRARMFKFPEGDPSLNITMLDYSSAQHHRDW